MNSRTTFPLENGQQHQFHPRMGRELALGISWSTQSVVAGVLHPVEGVLATEEVPFSDFNTIYGMSTGWAGDGMGEFVTTPKLFLAALDLVLIRLAECRKFKMSDIRYLTCNVQQHGIAALTAEFEPALAALDPKLPLEHQLDKAFARGFSAMWMTSNTSEECELFASAMGSAEAVAIETGATPQTRFSGPMWLHFAREMPRAFARTAQLTQFSGFVAGLFTGSFAPIEFGNGLGSNLLRSDGQWSPKILAECEVHAPGFSKKLPAVTHSLAVVGTVSHYFVERYGFSEHCGVVACTGDNPESALGTGLYSPTQARHILSLGTSITQFALVEREVSYDPTGYGVIFGGVAGGNLALNCFLNGMQTIEAIRDRFGWNWNQFGAALASTRPGNGGKWMVYLPLPEITPRTSDAIELYKGGTWSGIAGGDGPSTARAVVESRAAALVAYGGWMGRPKEVLVTGGASQDIPFLQVFADVTGATLIPVLGADSTTLGSMLRAARLIDPDVSFDVLTKRFCKLGSPVKPQVESGFYDSLVRDYAETLAQTARP